MIIIKEDGFADFSIVICRDEIIRRLNYFNINSIFTSSDGDHFFDDSHEKAFEEYKESIESGKPLVWKHNSTNPWPLSDLFHLVKNIRPKILFNNIGLSIDKYNPQELHEFIQNKSSITDKSSQGMMKNSCPLDHFGFDAFVGSKNHCQSNFLICSLFIFIYVIRNCKLNIETRKKYLQTAFLFANYYLHQIAYIKTIGIRICHIRLMKKIWGIYICTE